MSIAIVWNIWYSYTFFPTRQAIVLVFTSLCVTTLWIQRWHFIFPLPPETWALSLTTDYTGTLSIPLLNAPIICCIHKPFFNKPSCETNLLSICPVWESLKIKFPFWGILSPAEFEIKLHSVFFFHSDAETCRFTGAIKGHRTVLYRQTEPSRVYIKCRWVAHSTQDPCHCAKSAVLFSHSISESVSFL